MKLFLTMVLLSSIGFLACKKKDDDKEKGTAVKAKLAMSNGTELALSSGDCADGALECWTPTKYGLKIMNAYISPDAEGATSGPAGLIWNNPDCETQTTKSTIEEKEYEYDSMVDGCSDADITEYFELARDSDEVNADLNSQEYKILPGTYNYVQMGFCIGGAKSKNAQFQAEGMDEPFQVTSGTCGISSTKADPPIVVKEGESVTIELTYDLTNIISRYGTTDESNCFVSDDETIERCFGYPNSMVPSFANQ